MITDTQTHYESIWRASLGELEVLLSRPNFVTWFRGTFIIEITDNEAVIGVPHSFALEWLSKKYPEEILRVLQRQVPQTTLQKVSFKIAQLSAGPSLSSDSSHDSLSSPANDVPVVLQQPSVAPIVSALVVDQSTPGLNPNYTFDNFIVGTYNRFAHAASMAVASDPGKRYNPLFIYGGVGLGKTHLVQAIGNEILRQNPSKRILYASCEHFGNEFIQAIQTKRMDEFKRKYRNSDVLLIDDIQFLAGKDGTQEEFFHTFNALHQTGRQIVMTSDRVPQAIPELEDRLSSRFVWGMVTDIKNPDLETRSAILRQKCEERNLRLTDDVIELLARTFQNNIRELEGALNQLQTKCELEQLTPSYEVISRFLEGHRVERKPALSVDQIFSIVSNHYQIPTEDLLGSRRNKEFVYPRQVAMYLLRHELGYSYPKIGRELGKDHTTIMHGVEKIERDFPQNSRLQQELSALKDLLYRPTYS